MAIQPKAVSILCVDDDVTGLRFRQLILEAKGFRVLLTTSAQQGMDVFRSNPIDLVVADHLMGRATGTAMATALKRLKPNVPIIILTGSTAPPEGLEKGIKCLGFEDSTARAVANRDPAVAACQAGLRRDRMHGSLCRFFIDVALGASNEKKPRPAEGLQPRYSH